MRYLEKLVREILPRKMAFIGGPRQVGKTTMAVSILMDGVSSIHPNHPAYLNWEAPGVPMRVRKGELPQEEPLIILGEIHKYKHWRNLVKGLYDSQKSKRKFIVTGSARLDYYRRGGDSLVNRYRYFRLHPFSLCEYDPLVTRSSLLDLLQFGVFQSHCF